jgi:hypothetical protein
MNVGDGIIGAAASGLVGWLAASVTKVGKADFEKAQRQAEIERQRITDRLDALEKDLSGRMTRAEFEQAFSKVEALVREFRIEARAEFKDLKSELKTKT